MMLSTAARKARHKFGRVYIAPFNALHYPSDDEIAEQIAEDEAAVLGAIERCGSVASAFEMPGSCDGFFEEFGQVAGVELPTPPKSGKQIQAAARRADRLKAKRRARREKLAQEQAEALRRIEQWSLEFSAEGRKREAEAAAEERRREQVYERVRAFMNQLLGKWGAPEYFVGCGPSNKGNLMLTGHLGTLPMTRGIGDPQFWRSYHRSVQSLRRAFKKAA